VLDRDRSLLPLGQVPLRDRDLEDAHPAPPRHGGNNYIQLDLPNPADRLVVYRTKAGQLGVFFHLVGDQGSEVARELRASLADLQKESGLLMSIEEIDEGEHWKVSAVCDAPDSGERPETEQRKWLSDAE
jgi:hypothetical protein